jgi:hypothetical protein
VCHFRLSQNRGSVQLWVKDGEGDLTGVFTSPSPN